MLQAIGNQTDGEIVLFYDEIMGMWDNLGHFKAHEAVSSSGVPDTNVSAVILLVAATRNSLVLVP